MLKLSLEEENKLLKELLGLTRKYVAQLEAALGLVTKEPKVYRLSDMGGSE